MTALSVRQLRHRRRLPTSRRVRGREHRSGEPPRDLRTNPARDPAVAAEHRGSMSDDTATTLVNVIGWLDIALAVVFAGLVVAAIARKAIAYSPLAIGLFAW